MLQAKNRRKNLGKLVHISRSGCFDSRLRGASFGGKIESLLDCEGGEVNVIFRAVLNVAAIMASDIGGSERVIVDVSFN